MASDATYGPLLGVIASNTFYAKQSGLGAQWIGETGANISQAAVAG